MFEGNNISLAEATQNGANCLSEKIGEKGLDIIINKIKSKYGQACVDTGKAFELYLENSEKRYNKVKTLADLSEPRKLEGRNGIYVNEFIEYKDDIISADTVENLMKISQNIVIIGSGGTGKSMLIRHLFLNVHRRGLYVPVLVELRKIVNVESDNALLDLIHSCIESFDVKLDQDQFEYSLRTARYIFFFDGLDEVKEELRKRAQYLIQEISKKYPQNGYIVSSRKEGMHFNELQTFTVVKACPFNKKQAVELINKIGGKNEKTKEFARLLEKELYDKHKDFTSNPLLLTMMYITFMDNNKIPEHLTDFYENAYAALYKRHDANKEGLFKRYFKSDKLGEKEFKDLFAYFCFQSYFRQEYEFDKEDICEHIKNGINRLNLIEALDNPDYFFEDIKDIVCLIVEEGNKYRFAHRSFQTYFAAYYTAMYVADKDQKNFLKKRIRENYFPYREYFKMLYIMEGDRINKNILESGIEHIINKVKNTDIPDFSILNLMYETLYIEYDNRIGLSYNLNFNYERNIICIFIDLFYKRSFESGSREKLIDLLKNKLKVVVDDINCIRLDDFMDITPISLRNDFLDTLCKSFGMYKIFEKMNTWLEHQKRKNQEILSDSDRDELLATL